MAGSYRMVSIKAFRGGLPFLSACALQWASFVCYGLASLGEILGKRAQFPKDKEL